MSRPERGRPLHTPAWVSMGILGTQGARLAAVSATGDSAGVRLGLCCPSRGLRSPLLGLWPHLSVFLCVFTPLTLVCLCAPPPPRRRVPGGGAPRAAPAQRGAAPAEVAGPPASPAEPLLLCHPGGESNAAPSTSGRPWSSSWSPRARGLRLPAATGAALLGVPALQLRGSLGAVVSAASGLRGRGGSLGGRVWGPGLLS